MRVLGIDPGKTGAMALAAPGGLETRAMPGTPADRCALILELAPDFVMLERIEARPTFWRDKETGEEHRSILRSSLIIVDAAAELRGILVGLSIPFDEPRPQTWQKAIGAPPKAGKDGIKRIVQGFFPDARITKYAADAVGLALYGLRLRGAARGLHEPIGLFSPSQRKHDDGTAPF